MSIDHTARDAGDMHRYRTEIPNIVFEKLKDGAITPEDFVLYCVLKRTAGDRGNSTKSTKTLSDESKASPGGIVASKRRLINAGLIEVETVERMAGDFRLGGRPQHRITIVDVWPANMALFADQARASSPTDTASSWGELASSPTDTASSWGELASSPSGTKEENIPPFAKAKDGRAVARRPHKVQPSKPLAPHTALVVALLDELGEDNLNFARHVKDAKALAGAGFVPEDVRRIVRWLLRTKAEFFATEPLTMTTVRKYARLAPKAAGALPDGPLADGAPVRRTGRPVVLGER